MVQQYYIIFSLCTMKLHYLLLECYQLYTAICKVNMLTPLTDTPYIAGV